VRQSEREHTYDDHEVGWVHACTSQRTTTLDVCVCALVHALFCACARVRVCARTHARVCARTHSPPIPLFPHLRRHAAGTTPVLLREGNVLACTFHPEITGDSRCVCGGGGGGVGGGGILCVRACAGGRAWIHGYR
jgi:hypothetical protein